MTRYEVHTIHGIDYLPTLERAQEVAARVKHTTATIYRNVAGRLYPVAS